MVKVDKRVRIVLEGNDAIWLAHLARYSRNGVSQVAMNSNLTFGARVGSLLQRIAEQVPQEGFSDLVADEE